jgi:hypothetical protein
MKQLWTEKCSLYINKYRGDLYVLQKTAGNVNRNR